MSRWASASARHRFPESPRNETVLGRGEDVPVGIGRRACHRTNLKIPKPSPRGAQKPPGSNGDAGEKNPPTR